MCISIEPCYAVNVIEPPTSERRCKLAEIVLAADLAEGMQNDTAAPSRDCEHIHAKDVVKVVLLQRIRWQAP